MLVKSYAAAVQGISATVVTVEVNCSKGIQFFIVGLPDVAVRESHERIISALQVCGYKFPRNRIVINMAPADIRKEGSSYDLPLAIGILAVVLVVWIFGGFLPWALKGIWKLCKKPFNKRKERAAA